MDIRNSLEGLKTLLGVSQPAPAASQPRNGSLTPGGTSTLGSDRATLSSAGSEVAQTAAEPEVRMDKVAGIQAALNSGTYNVPAPAVASRLVDSMLGSDR